MLCRLKQLMADRGLTQSALAKEAVLSATTLRNLALNRFDRVDVRTIDTLATYFGLTSISQLFGLDNEVDTPPPSALPPAGWQPIESAALAPGLLMLGWEPDEGSGLVYLFSRSKFNDWVGTNGYSVEPTHWMPLPEPPAANPTTDRS